MKGKELIEWIQQNNAEDLECAVQYRDGGGSYPGGEVVEEPILALIKRPRQPDVYDIEIVYHSKRKPNCIVF